MYVLACVFVFGTNNKAGEEEKPLTYLRKKKIAYFWVKYFMLAIKIIVNKITKKRHLKQPYKSDA